MLRGSNCDCAGIRADQDSCMGQESATGEMARIIPHDFGWFL